MERTDSILPSGDNPICIAKLFCRRESKDWEELYVGVCDVVKRKSGDWCIIICGIEEKEGEIMVLAIDKNAHYEALNDVLLLWKEVLCCYSLSFLERQYRDFILEGIRTAQNEMMQSIVSDKIEEEKTLSLPPVSVENLSEIFNTVTNAEISQKEAFHSLLVDNDFKYLRDLLDLFPILESAHNYDGIADLLNLCRLIMELGYDDAVGVFFSESCYENYFGLMEYKPELPTKANFREFFKTQVHFKNTMSGLDPPLLSLIHKLYRLLYYRDAIDPQPIDDIIPSSLTSQINESINDLIQMICTNTAFVTELLKGFEGESCSMSLRILNELFLYCKDLTAGDKEALIRALEQKNNAFTVLLEKQLEHNHTAERTLLFNVMEFRISFSTDSYRQFVVSHKALSLEIICKEVCNNSCYDIQLICNSILHLLLSSDPLNSLQNSRLYDQFVRLFYENYATFLLPCIQNASPAASLVLSLLGDYEKNHGTNVQFLLLKNNLFPAILHLLDCPDRSLHLSCIQFMSRCLASTLSWYRRFIIKRNYLEPLFVYANNRYQEDSLVMSAFFNLLHVCFLKTGTDIAEYVQTKLNDFPNLLSLSIVSEIIHVRRTVEENGNAKVPHLSSD